MHPQRQQAYYTCCFTSSSTAQLLLDHMLCALFCHCLSFLALLPLWRCIVKDGIIIIIG